MTHYIYINVDHSGQIKFTNRHIILPIIKLYILLQSMSYFNDVIDISKNKSEYRHNPNQQCLQC